MQRTNLFLFGLVFLLAGCAAAPMSASSQAANTTTFKPAVNYSNTGIKGDTLSYNAAVPARPILASNNIIATADNKYKQKLVGKDAINAANKKALRVPTSGGYVDSIMTFDYMPGALYQVYCAPLTITDLQLQAGERVVSVAAGDTLRWQVTKTFSGGGENRFEHLLIKPTDAGLTNTLVVTTDQRAYHLLLYSTDKTYMPLVQWHYNDEDNGMIKNVNGLGSSSNEQFADLGQGLDINHLDFNYAVTLVYGVKPEWLPSLVFNDGNKTYIRLPRKIQEAPTLFIGSAKNGQIVNYRVAGNYYVVDSLFPVAQLRAGQDKQQIVVEIRYTR
jgi:type IV secretion system protein TrbG